MIAFLHIAGLILLPGLSAWMAFSRNYANRLSTGEQLYMILFSGVVLILWPLGLLTTLGRFQLGLVWASSLLLTLIFGGFAFRSWQTQRPAEIYRPASRQRWWPTAVRLLGILAISAAAVSFYGEPFEYLLGGRDHGVYINTGVHIAKTGQVLIEDAEMAALPAESRSVFANTATSLDRPGLPGTWSEGQRITGFTIRDLESGIYNPHAFHLYPAIFALFYSVGGVSTLLWATVCLNILGVWGIFRVSKRLYGPLIAWGTIGLWSFHLTQVYFSRYPSAEMLLQPLFWGGIFMFLIWIDQKWWFAGLISGLAFGLMHLAKLDTVFVPLFLLLYFGFEWVQQRQSWSWLAFWIPYLLVSLHATVHAFQISTIYFIDHLARTLLPGFLADRLLTAADGVTDPGQIWANILTQNGDLWLWTIAILIAGLIGLAVTQTKPFQKWIRPAFTPPAAIYWLVGLLVLLAMRPSLLINWGRTSGTLFGQVSWYFGFWILIIALIGFVVRWQKQASRQEWFFLGMFTLNVLPFFILGLGTAGDHFWAIRRLVPVLFPAIILFGLIGLERVLAPLENRSTLRLVMLGALILATGTRFIQQSRPYIGPTEYAGVVAALEDLDTTFPADAVILMKNTGPGVMFGTPMWLVHDRPLFLITPETADPNRFNLAIEYWHGQGRPVYYLTDQGQFDLSPTDMQFSEQGQWAWSFLQSEAPNNRPPERYLTFQGAFTIYEIRPEEG